MICACGHMKDEHATISLVAGATTIVACICHGHNIAYPFYDGETVDVGLEVRCLCNGFEKADEALRAGWGLSP